MELSSNKVLSLTQEFRRHLEGVMSDHEAEAMAKILMEDLTGKELSKLLADQDLEWNQVQVEKIQFILDGLKDHQPFQYLMGYTEFMGCKFKVRPGVLIPRGETEELVLWVIEKLKANGVGSGKGIKILDIGCGSGIIGIMLALNFPEANVICCDKYKLPLETTLENASLNNVDIGWSLLDVLHEDDSDFEERFDVIVSNPPYVTNEQKRLMKMNVLEYEPDEALFISDEDPLIFYRKIAQLSEKLLKPDGALFFEINENFGHETKLLLSSYFDLVELRKDIHQKDRMIIAFNET